MPVEVGETERQSGHARWLTSRRLPLCAGVVLLAVGGSLAFFARQPKLHAGREIDTWQDFSLGKKHIVNSAAGVSLWENMPSEASKTSRKRYAVAYAWSDPDIFYKRMKWPVGKQSVLSPYFHGKGVCALALTAIASRKLLQASVGEEGVAEAVVLTDGMASEQMDYLRSVGIRIVLSNLTDLYTWQEWQHYDNYYPGGGKHRSYKDGFFKLRATTLKAGLAGLTEYAFLIYLDVDAWLPSPPIVDMFHGHRNVEFVTAIDGSNMSPLSVGRFALKPRQAAFEDMMRRLRDGFSLEKGWGKQGLRIGVHGWKHLNCKRLNWHNKAYCKDRNTSRWDFLAAQGDKGILFTEYSVVRNTALILDDGPQFDHAMTAFNWYGPGKPWMPETKCYEKKSWQSFDPIARLDQYWSLYHKYSRPEMVSPHARSSLSSFCLASLDEAQQSHRRLHKKCTPSHKQSA